MHEAIEALSDTRREIMLHLKHSGGATIAELAAHLGISDEGTRQHLIHLERHGWVTRRDARDSTGRSGRPASIYMVSRDGESFFPKQYEHLTFALADALVDLHGQEGLEATLERVVERKVAEWEPRLRGKSRDERLALLKDYYAQDDKFSAVENNGTVAIVQRNCPYLNVALTRPSLCSTTINVLSRLLGCQVQRTQSFQRGHGCCRFEILVGQPIDPARASFAFEPEMPAGEDD